MIISKKQLGFALPLVILIAVVLVIIGGAGYYFYKMEYKYSSPEKTFSLLIKAAEEGDTDAYLECFTKESQETLKTTARLIPGDLKAAVKFYKETEFKVTEKTDDRAVMISSISMPGTIRIFVFEKEKWGWKVDIIQPQRDIKRVTDLMGKLRRGALEFYYDQHGGYPVLTDTSEDGEFLKILVDKGYLAEMFLDPLHPEYFYEYKGTKNSYTLKCYCEIEGGNCDMADGVKDHVLIITFP